MPSGRLPPVSTLPPSVSAWATSRSMCVELAGGAQRAHLGFVLQRVANPDIAGQPDHPLQKLVGDILVQIQPRSGDTALPGRAEDAGNRGIHRAFDIGIVKHDERRLAAQFQTTSAKLFLRVFQHMPRRAGPAGKRYPRHQRMRGQRPAAGVAMAGDDVDHAGWEAGLARSAGRIPASPPRRARTPSAPPCCRPPAPGRS